MDYKITIDNFEGPLDLLLFFIQRDKMDIYDIEISKITNDFLIYISNMKNKRLKIGAEFILMASILMNIKTKMLLPDDEILLDEIDLKADLTQKLIEYKKFKEMSENLSNIYDSHSETHKVYIKNKNIKDLAFSEKIDLTDLAIIFSKLIKENEISIIDINFDKIDVKNKISLIKSKLLENKEFTLSSLIENFKQKIHLICTFIALLELLKDKYITLKQKKTYSEIYISKI